MGMPKPCLQLGANSISISNTVGQSRFHPVGNKSDTQGTSQAKCGSPAAEKKTASVLIVQPAMPDARIESGGSWALDALNAHQNDRRMAEEPFSLGKVVLLCNTRHRYSNVGAVAVNAAPVHRDAESRHRRQGGGG